MTDCLKLLASFSRHTIAPAVGVMLLAGCSSTNPSTGVLDDFVATVKAADGTVATETRGAAPAASGGPSVTATPVGGSSASGTVSNGGSSAIQLRATSPFTQVFVSVANADGFFTLTLPAATTDTVVIVGLGSAIPVNTFQTVFSVRTAGGQVGPSSSVAETVTPSTVTSYQGVWHFGDLPTGATGTCAGDPTLNRFNDDGLVTVSSSGSFTVPDADFNITGTMNLSSGAWSLSGFQTASPGNTGCSPLDTRVDLSASGTCSSFTSCSGTFSIVTSPSGGRETGNVIWSR